MKKNWIRQVSFVAVTCMSLSLATMFLVPSVSAEGGETTVEAISVVMESHQLRLDAVVSKDESKIVYRATPIEGSTLSKDRTYHIVFDRTALPNSFPKNELNGWDVDVTGVLSESPEDSKVTVMEVSQWGLHSTETGAKSYLVEMESVQFNKPGMVTYFVKSLDGSNVERITFREQDLGAKFPRQNLVGSKFLASGSMFTSDDKNVLVKSWVSIDDERNASNDAVGEVTGETKTYYGEFKHAIAETMEDGSYIIDAKFVDFDGKEYIARFDSRFVKNMPDLYTVTFKSTVQAEPKGLDGDHPVLQVKSYTVEQDNFEFRTDEIVSTVGQVGNLINRANGRMTYEFLDGKKKYIAVFDQEVLGEGFMSESLKGKSLELTGVVYKEVDSVYLGVMGYRDPYKSGVVGSTTNGMTSYSFEGTVTYLLSYTEKEAMYKVITSNGEERTVVFSKELLKDKLPTQSLIGKNFNFVTMYKGKTLNANTKLLVGNFSMSNASSFTQDRGKFIKVMERSASSVIFEFESIEGGRYNVLLTTESVEKFGGEKALTGKVATLYGKESTYRDERIFDAFLITPVNSSHFNKNDAETVSFTGFIQKVSQRDSKGITFLVTNQYGQSEYIYFETDFLASKFPAAVSLSSMMKTEVTVSGYRLSNGKIMVKDFNFPKIPTEYPDEIKPKYEDPEYFPNMKGFTGILDVSDIGGTHLMLVTASDKYLLNGKPEVLKQIENNLRNIVYLRGEYREAGAPYWTGEIKVYDIQVLDNNTNTITKPIGSPVGDLIPDPQKEAHHTIQIPTELPKEYKYGHGIPEALYIPEAPMPKDIPLLK